MAAGGIYLRVCRVKLCRDRRPYFEKYKRGMKLIALAKQYIWDGDSKICNSMPLSHKLDHLPLHGNINKWNQLQCTLQR